MIYPLNPTLTELLLLSIIAKNDSYGYIISQSLMKVSNLKDSALYPILKRLSDQNYVEIYDQQFQGRNRKYYRITQIGEERRAELQTEWQAYCKEIDEILKLEQAGEIKQTEEMKQNAAEPTVIEGGKEND